MTVRVLVVDDSPSMRALISATLRRDPQLEVVGQAGDPHEARAAIKALNPDVMTLDVEMPHMNGLDFLEKIMRLRPMPVVMVSSLTRRGAEAAVEAMAIGAVACVGKPAPGQGGFESLPATVRAASQARVGPQNVEPAMPAQGSAPFVADGRVLAIGSSTGGVEALLGVFSAFPANCPPTVVAQHMPPGFTASFAARLDRVCAPEVREAVDGAPLRPGTIYVAKAGMHLEIAGRKAPRCVVQEGEKVNGHQPSVDVLFRSVARTMGAASCGVILTGMGRDGAEGLLEMRRSGADTLGQDEASSVVYGMPRAAMELGAVARQVALRDVGRSILKLMTENGK